MLLNKDKSSLLAVPAGLSAVTIPASVTKIGSWAFYSCTDLTSIEIPESVTSIGYYAFKACSNLTSLEIPESVTSIGESAFGGCYNLTSMKLPSSLTSISYGTFQGCSKLTSIEIPASVTNIGQRAFQGCNSLTSIAIPPSVTNIKANTFEYCSSLTSIEIPSSVTDIGDYAFSGCRSLTSIEIPSSVTSIGGWAFQYCYGLASITIPTSVTSIGSSAFYGCDHLTSIEIPESVTSIERFAFYDSGLTSIEIPAYVTSIGDRAIELCTDLTRVILPKNLSTLSSNAFNRCSSLREVILLTENGSCLEAFKSILDELKEYGTVTVYSLKSILEKLPDMDHVQKRYLLSAEPSGMWFTRAAFSFESVVPFATVEKVYWGEELLSPTDEVYSLDGLTPGNTYTITADIAIDGVSYPGLQYTLQTAGLDVEQTETGATTAALHGHYTDGAAVSKEGFEGYDWTNNTLRLAGLDPDTEYTVRYYVVSTEEGTFTKDYTFRTDALEFGLPSAQVTSNTVVLRAGTNLSGRETSAGLEWRRADAPEQKPSTQSFCQAVDGVLTETLRNLSANTSYKFRPYYISASGKTYYGEWATFTTEDGMGIAAIGSDAEGLEVAVRGNLAQGSAALRVTGDGGEAFWTLTTLSGSVSAQGAVAADGTWQALEASGLPRGIYLLTVRNGQSAKTVKVTTL